MTDADGVIEAIDSALWDYSVSRDAMRWAPDVPCPDSAEKTDDTAFRQWLRATLTSVWPILERVATLSKNGGAPDEHG